VVQVHLCELRGTVSADGGAQTCLVTVKTLHVNADEKTRLVKLKDFYGFLFTAVKRIVSR
jgi:hypothetical protein